MSRSGTANPPYREQVLSVVPVQASANLDILSVRFDNKLTFGDHLLSAAKVERH